MGLADIWQALGPGGVRAAGAQPRGRAWPMLIATSWDAMLLK